MRTAERAPRDAAQHLGRKLASVPRRCQIAATGIPTLQDFSQLLPEMTLLMLKRFRKEATCLSARGPRR